MARLADQLAALPTMSSAQLRAEWQRVHKAPAPRVSPDLLIRGVAWRMQERALGGLPPSASRELARLASARQARGGGKTISAAPTGAADLRPGTTLNPPVEHQFKRGVSGM